MPEYQYEALDQNGKTRKGLITADNEAEARQRVREGVGYVARLRALESSGGAQARSRVGKGLLARVQAALQGAMQGSVRQEDLVAMTRQLSTLLKAGIPLDEALEGMVRQGVSVPLRTVVTRLRERLREGGSLAAGMREFPKVFDAGFVALVQAGEASGALGTVMERLAETSSRRQNVTRKLNAAMAYPILMLLVGGLILGFLLSFVVPKVTQLFVDAKQALPTPTVILMAASGWFSVWWPLLAAAPFVIWLAFVRAMKVPHLRRMWHSLQLRLPVMGELARCTVLGRVAHTLALLLTSGVPLLTALNIARGVADNAIMEETVDQVSQAAESGGSLSTAMEKSPFFRPSDIQLVAAGERGGQLENMLFFVAADNEDKAMARTQMFTALMEPLMILFLGVVVGFVVLAIILPIFEMSNLVR